MDGVVHADSDRDRTEHAGGNAQGDFQEAHGREVSNDREGRRQQGVNASNRRPAEPGRDDQDDHQRQEKRVSLGLDDGRDHGLADRDVAGVVDFYPGAGQMFGGVGLGGFDDRFGIAEVRILEEDGDECVFSVAGDDFVGPAVAADPQQLPEEVFEAIVGLGDRAALLPEVDQEVHGAEVVFGPEDAADPGHRGQVILEAADSFEECGVDRLRIGRVRPAVNL